MPEDVIELPAINVYPDDVPPPIGSLAAQDGYELSTRAPFVQGEKNTRLNQLDEFAFRQWAKDNKVPFDTEAAQTDYDMRGYWRAQQNQDPRARSGVDPSDNRVHYPDYWKTPQHKTFSNESQWARPDTPSWVGEQLVSPDGRVQGDDTRMRDALWRMGASAETDRLQRPAPYYGSEAPGLAGSAVKAVPEALGITEAYHALHGDMSPQEAQEYFAQAAVGGVLGGVGPGKRLTQGLARGVGEVIKRAEAAVPRMGSIAADEFATMAARGKIHPARTAQQDLHAVLQGKVPAVDFDIGGTGHPLGQMYETGVLTKRLEDAGLHVIDNRMGKVVAGRTADDAQALLNAKTPADYGRASGYSPDDIARFYLERRGGNVGLAHPEFSFDHPLAMGSIANFWETQGDLSRVPRLSAEARSAGKPAVEPIPANHPVYQYLDNPQRVLKKGVYKDPREIAAIANSRVAPEHPAMKELFGVTRDDLYEISQQGRRQGNITEPNIWAPENPSGSQAARNVMNPRNAQRLVDTLTEAKNFPDLAKGMVPWYVMDPAFQRLVELVGKERAIVEYTRFNSMMTPFSASSDVMKEINRGTAARMMADKNRFPEFVAQGGKPVHTRGADFPPEMAGVIPHLRHKGHTDPVTRYLLTGEHGYGNDTVKIPLYTQASGVPETGFQTRFAVPDAHFTRASGMSDVRTNAAPGNFMGGAEYRTFGPWFREHVATPSGLEAVPAQALMWGAYGPQTGVKTLIGAPKLELLSQRIWERAHALGIDPKKLRDDVLQGKAHATWLLGGAIGGAGAAGKLRMGDVASPGDDDL